MFVAFAGGGRSEWVCQALARSGLVQGRESVFFENAQYIILIIYDHNSANWAFSEIIDDSLSNERNEIIKVNELINQSINKLVD